MFGNLYLGVGRGRSRGRREGANLMKGMEGRVERELDWGDKWKGRDGLKRFRAEQIRRKIVQGR